MFEPEIQRSASLESLRTLPRLTPTERQVLERLLVLAPDVAVATASAVVQAHQRDLHDLIFPSGRESHLPEVARLARVLVYLGLAMAAPGQGKLMPILRQDHLRRAQAQHGLRLAAWGQAARRGQRAAAEAAAVPDPELRRVLEVLIERMSVRSGRDPRWLRAVTYSEAGAFYAALAEACAEQFAGVVDLDAVTAHLERVGRTRELLADVLADEEEVRTFNPTRQRDYLDRLRRLGWDEHVASVGRNLREIAAEGTAHGFSATTTFALSDEWLTKGASQPTTGRRYLIRPTLVPDSAGLALWAQEERLRPLQKLLAGDPRETGLRLTLGSVELLLEYAIRARRLDFLNGQWTRVSNQFDRLHLRFGGMADGRYAITLFPGARLDPEVGVCPVVEVEAAAS